MDKRRNNLQKGITLIALVISIIVMLILAGVSLNATIGDNGIITQAQNAKQATAVGKFNEYMQGKFFELTANNSKYSIEDLYVSSGWLERKLETDDETGNAYYLYIINKSKITDEEMLENMENGAGDPFKQEDVYGINPDFTIWYKNDNGELLSSTIQVVAIDDSTKVNFANRALSQAISNAVGVDREDVTIGNLKDVSTLKLNYDGTDSNIKNLDDLYYLPRLSTLYIYNLNLENINGLKYCNKLNEIYFYRCNINDFVGLSYSVNIRTIKIEGNNGASKVGITDDNVETFFKSISELKGIETLQISNSLTNLTDTNKINNGLQNLNGKNNIKNLRISNCRISGGLNINGFSNVEQIYLCYNYNLTGIDGLDKLNKLRIAELQNNNLQDLSKLKLTNENVYKSILLKGNKELTIETVKAISPYLLMCNEYSIEPEFTQYIQGNKILNYSGAELADGDISNIPDSVITLDLTNNKKLTNIDFLKNNTNITTLTISECTGISQEKLTDVLKTLKNLTILRANSLVQLTDITFIKDLENLKQLEIYNTNVEFLNSENLNAQVLNNSGIQLLKIGATSNKYNGNNIDLQLIQPCISQLSFSEGLRLVTTETNYKKFANQLSECTEITSLVIRYYQWIGVEKIDLTKCKKLKRIELVSNNFGVKIAGLENLQELRMTTVKSFGQAYYKIPDVTGCTSLNKIYFEGNFMTSSDLNNMVEQLGEGHNLQYLSLNKNSISNISSVSKLRNLTYLSLNNNNLSSLDGIQNLPNLVEIGLKYNNLSNKDLDMLVDLHNKYNKILRIYLYGNNITDYSPIEKFAQKDSITAP